MALFQSKAKICHLMVPISVNTLRMIVDCVSGRRPKCVAARHVPLGGSYFWDGWSGSFKGVLLLGGLTFGAGSYFRDRGLVAFSSAAEFEDGDQQRILKPFWGMTCSGARRIWCYGDLGTVSMGTHAQPNTHTRTTKYLTPAWLVCRTQKVQKKGTFCGQEPKHTDLHGVISISMPALNQFNF